MPLVALADDRADPMQGRRHRVARWLLGLLVCATGLAFAGAQVPVTLAQADRIEADGRVIPVTLPDGVEGKGDIERHYRLSVDLGTRPSGMALYLPGMLAHGRIAINDHVIFDSISEPLAPRPRGLKAIRLVELPPAFMVDGRNRIDITLRAQSFLSLSRVIVGNVDELDRMHDRKVLGAVFGPLLVSTVIACMGVSVLLIYLRRRSEPMYGYFAIGSIAWGLHTAWTVLPYAPLPGVHNAVWWTALYSFFVIMLLNFALRFAGYALPRLESALLAACLAAPLVLYAANVADALHATANVWRFGLVVAAFGTLIAVARSAWRKRSLESSLLVVASFAAASLGLRDWVVFQRDDDNFPIALAPYSALPLVVLVAWFLIDRFVRTAESLEDLNRELESRVERKGVELLHALERMRDARDEANAANQAKSSFLAAASHDLRQPIHALGLYLGALRQRAFDPAAAEIVQRMDGSLGALDSMFNALLDISRMDAGVVIAQPRAFDLEAMLRRLVEEFAPQAAQRGLRLSVRIAATARARIAVSDPMLMERVLRNLIGNAVKYTQAGGVLVTCRPRGNRYWRIEVWDTGPGIPESERERIFEEFYQVGNPERDRRSGLGLGLSIVRRLARLLNLPLAVESRPGRGTRFCVDVSATDEVVALPQAIGEGGSLQGLVVAMIEDDPEVRDSMRTLLESWGCSVLEGSTATEVVQRLRGMNGQAYVPQAVIADLRLRGESDGIGEVRELHERLAQVMPALIVSGDSAPERVRMMQDSGLPWLSKPVPAARLRSWLSSVAQAVPGQELPPTTRENSR
jgi:signal transduction histidine kinase/CheY-like chemotaxis protein